MRRGGGLLRLNPRLTRLLDPAARQRGLVDGALLTEWDRVVGPELAARCQPVRVRRVAGRGVLTIRAAGPVAMELQHAAPQIVQRINDYFGFGAVARLKLIQAPVVAPDPASGAEGCAASAAQLAAIEALVRPVEPAGLREALLRLGTSLATAPEQESAAASVSFRRG